MKKLIIATAICLSSLVSFAKTTSITANQINFENKAISCDLGNGWNDQTGFYLDYKDSSSSWPYQEKRTFYCTGDRCRDEHKVTNAKCIRYDYDEDQAYLKCDMIGQYTYLNIDLATAVVNENEYNDNAGPKIRMEAKLTEKRKILSDVTHQVECEINL